LGGDLNASSLTERAQSERLLKKQLADLRKRAFVPALTPNLRASVLETSGVD